VLFSAASFICVRGWYLPGWIAWISSVRSSPSAFDVCTGSASPPSRASSPRPSPRFFAAMKSRIPS